MKIEMDTMNWMPSPSGNFGTWYANLNAMNTFLYKIDNNLFELSNGFLYFLNMSCHRKNFDIGFTFISKSPIIYGLFAEGFL